MASRTWFSRRCGLAPGGLPCGLPGVPREGCTDRGRQCGSCAGTEAGQWDCRWTAVGLAVGTAGSGAHLVFLGALDDTQKGDPGRRRRRVRVRVRVNVSQGQGQCQVSRGGQGAKGPRGQGAKGQGQRARCWSDRVTGGADCSGRGGGAGPVGRLGVEQRAVHQPDLDFLVPEVLHNATPKHLSGDTCHTACGSRNGQLRVGGWD